MSRDRFFSVDVETSGPIPGTYSLLSIGACLVDRIEEGFERSLKPVNSNQVPEAMAVTGLDFETLAREGLDPHVAMAEFAAWIRSNLKPGEKPVFVGLAAPFDWAFVNHYFLTYSNENPFGFTALDIKALYMGATGCPWSDARSSVMKASLGVDLSGDHTPLTDARFQAALFDGIMKRIARPEPRQATGSDLQP